MTITSRPAARGMRKNQCVDSLHLRPVSKVKGPKRMDTVDECIPWSKGCFVACFSAPTLTCTTLYGRVPGSVQERNARAFYALFSELHLPHVSAYLVQTLRQLLA